MATKKSLFERKSMKDQQAKVSEEGEKTTPFFGTGYEQGQFIRDREA